MSSPLHESSTVDAPQDQAYFQDSQTQQDLDLTGGLPINLDSLRDGPPGSKPFYPYSTLIRYAIKGSPGQKLLLEDIYYAIESRFPYFRTAPAGWKNSVRHNLSLNPCFEKMPRPLSDRGKGSYWTVNDKVDPRTGVHRERRKRTKNLKSRRQHRGDDQDHEHDQEHDPEQLASQMHFDPAQMQFPLFGPNGEQLAEDGVREDLDYPGDPDAEGQYNMDASSGMGYSAIPAGSPYRTEVDEHGNMNWRNVWHNELAKLQEFTAHQDKIDADPVWYRMMVARVRGAAFIPIEADELPMSGAPPVMEPDIQEDGEDVPEEQ